jgi:hypothetical protein
MSLFVRLTLAIAAILIGFAVLAFVVKLLIVAAVLAAVVFAGAVAVAAVRRRFARPARTGVVMTLTAGR